MGLFCAYEIQWYIYEKKPIFIEYIHRHWQFNCDPDWDSQKNNGVELNTNSLSQKYFLPGTLPWQNSVSPENSLSWEKSFVITFSFKVLHSPTISASNKNFSSIGNALLLGNSDLDHLFLPVNLPLPLDLCHLKIEEPLMVIFCGQSSESLNKKWSQKDNYFEQLTRREMFQFEHIKRDFSIFLREICRRKIQENVVQRS